MIDPTDELDFDPEIYDGEDFNATEIENLEEELVDAATAARTIEELDVELADLARLKEQARRVRALETDRKWSELRTIIEEEALTGSVNDPRKLIIFTEHRDTLDYLARRIRTMIGRHDAVATIHGGVRRSDRRQITQPEGGFYLRQGRQIGGREDDLGFMNSNLLLLKAKRQEPKFADGYQTWRGNRLRFLEAIDPDIEGFLEGSIDLAQLRDRAGGWNGQGFQGNCLMLLNQLVRWTPPGESEQVLRQVFEIPSNIDEAAGQLAEIVEWIQTIVASGRGRVPERTMIKGRSVPLGMPDLTSRQAPCIASWFWGIRDPQGWPILFPAIGDSFVESGISDGGTPRSDLYRSFVRLAETVKSDLKLETWEFEYLTHLCWP